MTENKITWQELLSRVRDCKDKTEFTKFSEMDSCIKDADLLLAHTPDTADYSTLRDATTFTKTRIQIFKNLKKREVNQDYENLTEGDVLKDVYAIRMNRNFENDYWKMYDTEIAQESVPVNQNQGTPFDWGLVFTILSVFFAVYLINFFISGKFERKRLAYKLRTLELGTYASILDKSIDVEEVYDKKREKKKGTYIELSTEERLILEKILKNSEEIDLAYSLKIMLNQEDLENKAVIEKRFEDLLLKIVNNIKV